MIAPMDDRKEIANILLTRHTAEILLALVFKAMGEAIDEGRDYTELEALRSDLKDSLYD
jgi:hypothetical protein